MLEMLFGAEMPPALRFFVAFVIVLALIAVTAFVVRRFGADRLGTAGARGRQPRLAVVDTAAVDGRRRLLLIRRDNVEHLVMIGGPTDVLVESSIVRAANAPREATPARPPAATDTLPRPVPLGEGNMWPLQPAEPTVRVEPTARNEPIRSEPVRAEPVRPEPRAEPSFRSEPLASRPARATAAQPVPHDEWSDEPNAEPPVPIPAPLSQRPTRAVDPLPGLATELAKVPAQSDPEASRPRREPTRPTSPVPAPTPPQSNADGENAGPDADQNLAEMAHRLEAALRRPNKTEPRAAEATPPRPDPTPAAAPAVGEVHYDDNETPTPTPAPQRAASPAPGLDMRPSRGDPRALRKPSRGSGGKNPYDSLEQEMASLLSRPNKT